MPRGRTSDPGAATLRRAAEALGAGLALCQGDAIVWANRALARLLGCGDAASLAGTSLAATLEGESGGAVDLGPRRDLECWLRPSQNGRRPVRVRCLGEGDAAGETLWSIEERARESELEAELGRFARRLHDAERELVALRERARREATEREELLTVVSHELRTPVTVIGGYNRLLLSERVGPLNEEQRRFLQESTKSCQRLNAFIGNLLETARESAGDGVLEVCEASLVPTIEGVTSFLKPLLEEHGLRIVFDFDPGGSRARFDPLRLEQVLTNLLGNAVKYARDGGTIEVATRAVQPGGRRLIEVTVSDDGPGVPLADRQRIFEPYVRAGEASRAGGLGLGLAICKRLVEAHGGTIEVGDRPGGGSRFAFTLPAAQPRADGSV